jgi:hypothetical protein
MTHPADIITLIAVTAIVLAAIKWAFLPFLPYRRLPRHRVRHLRLRLHLKAAPRRRARHHRRTVAAVGQVRGVPAQRPGPPVPDLLPACLRATQQALDPQLPEVERLQAALRKAGAAHRLVADFGAASWCDLVILAMINDEDTTCLMADPLSREAAFGEFLLWSLGGHIPPRYRPYADPGPLVAEPPWSTD